MAEEPRPAVELGRVVGAHALRGELRVRYFGDGPESLLGLDAVWLAPPGANAQPGRYAVLKGGFGRPGEVRLALAGVTSREAALALKGQLVLVHEDALEPLAEGEYYWHQLIGCRVATAEGRELGRVTELWQTGAHDLLVVSSGAGAPLLVPTAAEIMRSVDLEAGLIVIDAIPGLLGEAS